jgi:DNA-3-methyladenine glycosylase II
MSTAVATHVLEPLGPLDLARTRAFIGRWGPVARHTPAPARRVELRSAPSRDEPLRLTAPLDGDQRPVAFALRQAVPDGPVEVEIAGAEGEPRCRAALARVHGRHPDDPLDDLVAELRPYRTWVALLLRVAR